MTRTRKAIIGVCVLGVAGASLSVLTREKAPPAASPKAEIAAPADAPRPAQGARDPGTADLEARYRDLEKRYEAMNKKIDDLAVQDDSEVVEVDVPGAERAPLAAASEEERKASIDRSVERAAGVLEPYFEQDPVEPAWSAQTEGEIAQYLMDEQHRDVQLEGVECRSRVCRVNLTFTDEGSASDFVMSASTTHPWKYSAQMLPQSADNPLAVTLYIGRQGYNLPPI
ncbi:MAG: hypothetical protein R3B70_46690 [Polyangiaceae bacterium]